METAEMIFLRNYIMMVFRYYDLPTCLKNYYGSLLMTFIDTSLLSDFHFQKIMIILPLDSNGDPVWLSFKCHL